VIDMNRKYFALAAMLGVTGYANAGTTMVSPALAACSRALVESIRADPLPTYTVKAPSGFVSERFEKNSFTLLAHSKKTQALVGKASCKATPSGEILEFKSLPVKS
jgi:hypothetical protein